MPRSALSLEQTGLAWSIPPANAMTENRKCPLRAARMCVFLDAPYCIRLHLKLMPTRVFRTFYQRVGLLLTMKMYFPFVKNIQPCAIGFTNTRPIVLGRLTENQTETVVLKKPKTEPTSVLKKNQNTENRFKKSKNR